MVLPALRILLLPAARAPAASMWSLNSSIDLEAAANDVRDKVSQASRSFPDDLPAPPVVSKADASSDAIISMTVQSNTRNQLRNNRICQQRIGGKTANHSRCKRHPGMGRKALGHACMVQPGQTERLWLNAR